jgi:hypothetical protein
MPPVWLDRPTPPGTARREGGAGADPMGRAIAFFRPCLPDRSGRTDQP